MQQKISTNRLAIFAYGSLLYRPGFEFVGRQRAVAHGFARSFSQASPDHRGTPEKPGRVLTLRRDPAASTVGAIYVVEAPAEALLAELDYRERAGYERVSIEVSTAEEQLSAITWIALPGNAHDVGQLPLEALAQHVRSSVGPSGKNADYVLALEAALRELQAADPLVSALAALLRV
jgi:glutathione-specific gamma-glutamylcyclotransferase